MARRIHRLTGECAASPRVRLGWPEAAPPGTAQEARRHMSDRLVSRRKKLDRIRNTQEEAQSRR